MDRPSSNQMFPVAVFHIEQGFYMAAIDLKVGTDITDLAEKQCESE